MSEHRESHEFSLTLHVSATFPEEYEGEQDGYAWRERFERDLKPRIVKAVFDEIRATKGWRALAAPRGSAPDRAVDIDVECVIDD